MRTPKSLYAQQRLIYHLELPTVLLRYPSGQFLAHTRYLLPRKVWPPLNLADLETYERLCQVAQLGLKR